MKEWLVDVPVQINIWIRPEQQRRQFEIIREARPRILFLVSDGGRNQEEWDAIGENRRMYDEEVDWDCEIYRTYKDENCGMYYMAGEIYSLVWSKVDRCIFLEDDILPSVSYFQFCAEILERYKDDLRVSMVCGMNHAKEWESEHVDYFFSRRGSIWGLAFWKRTYELNWNTDYQENPYLLDALFSWTKDKKDYKAQAMSYIRTGYCDGHPPGPEFYLKNSHFAQYQLAIIPSKNMIRNIGFGESSAHGDSLERLPRATRRLFDMPTYELEFPLRHPNFVIPDVKYEAEHARITGYGHPIISRFRQIERFFLILKSGDFDYLLQKVKTGMKQSRVRES